MTTTIRSSGATVLTEGVVYALPARAGRVHALAAIEISPDGTTFDTLTGADTVGADVASGFVRVVSTTTPTTIVFRPY